MRNKLFTSLMILLFGCGTEEQKPLTPAAVTPAADQPAAVSPPPPVRPSGDFFKFEGRWSLGVTTVPAQRVATGTLYEAPRDGHVVDFTCKVLSVFQGVHPTLPERLALVRESGEELGSCRFDQALQKCQGFMTAGKMRAGDEVGLLAGNPTYMEMPVGVVLVSCQAEVLFD